MLILSSRDVSTVLRNLSDKDLSDTLDALARGLVSYTSHKETDTPGQPLIQQPHRTSITVNGDTTLIMPVSDSSVTSVKVVTVPRNGPIQGAITIYDQATGQLQGVLSAAEITAFRTALTTMSIVTRCKQLNIKEAVVFGAGKQVEWHIRLMLRLVPGITRVTVVNRSRGRLDALRQELSGDVDNIELDLLSHEDYPSCQTTLGTHLQTADIVSCCTPSTSPLFSASALHNNTSTTSKKPRLITLIGSYKPHMQEIDTGTLLSARKIWVDSKEACLAEAGELIRAKVEAAQLSEIGELLASPERQAIEDEDGEKGELTVFKCVGLGIMDLVVAKHLINIAKKSSVGTSIADF